MSCRSTLYVPTGTSARSRAVAFRESPPAHTTRPIETSVQRLLQNPRCGQKRVAGRDKKSFPKNGA